MKTVRVAFVDESGSPSPADGSRFLAVSVLVLESSRSIELHVRRTRRSLHRRSAVSELKAAQTDEEVIRRFLGAIAEESCEIYGVILDKSRIASGDAESAYQTAVAYAIALVAEQHPVLRITIDKRYTRPQQRLQLELTIREAIAGIPQQVITIEQADSMSHPGLQAADFVAWALRQQAEGAGEWAALVQHRIVEVKTLRPQSQKK